MHIQHGSETNNLVVDTVLRYVLCDDSEPVTTFKTNCELLTCTPTVLACAPTSVTSADTPSLGLFSTLLNAKVSGPSPAAKLPSKKPSPVIQPTADPTVLQATATFVAAEQTTPSPNRATPNATPKAARTTPPRRPVASHPMISSVMKINTHHTEPQQSQRATRAVAPKNESPCSGSIAANGCTAVDTTPVVSTLEKATFVQNAEAVLQKIVLPSIAHFMCDANTGNKLPQIIANLTKEQIRLCIDNIRENCIAVCTSKTGSENLKQFVYRCIALGMQDELQAVFKGNIVALTRDSTAGSFLQSYFRSLTDAAHRQYIFDELHGHVKDIACTSAGSLFLQTCIEASTGSQLAINQQSMLLAEIIHSSSTLAFHGIGCHSLHVALEVRNPLIVNLLVRSFSDRILDLCKNKFGVCVVEKCMKVATESDRVALTVAIVKESVLPALVNDCNGCRAVFAVISHAPAAYVEQVLCVVKAHAANIKSCPFGKKILTKCGAV